ncbi:MAG TPA: SIMPL domain-containing protein [bacterium]|nr:SIMPL domain-containing protein [bacterium]HOF79465.1 SIMPL domain-containing protein [bacterium]HOH85264.1 SIMPL domain-containing protein [bacterium]HOQ91841.1 SIMPL domain-containing protein [bacterium]HPL22408.1 SIMPL domain-containing protein [bacterium]
MKQAHFIMSLAALLAVTAIVITALVTTNKTNNQDRFSSNGSGTVYAKADIANIQVGFKSGVKKTAAEATTESTAKMNNIIAALQKLGIEEKDIKTSNYNLSPSYNWTNTKGQELVGYEVSQNLTLKVRDLNKIGDVIARTTEQGANQIGNVSFTIDDEFELRNQARELAIQQAKEKAALIAKQSGMKLGEIKGVYENTDLERQQAAYSNTKMMIDSSIAGAELATPSVQVGQNEIRAEVTLMYEVK